MQSTYTSKGVDEYFSSEYLKNLVLFFQQENEIDIVSYSMSVLRSEQEFFGIRLSMLVDKIRKMNFITVYKFKSSVLGGFSVYV